MGVSVAAAAVIITTGLLTAILIITATLSDTFTDLQDASDARNEKTAQRNGGAIRVDNVSKGAANITINVTNTGSTTLDLTSLQVLVNGTLQTANINTTSVAGANATKIWAPLEVLWIEVAVTPVVGERVEVYALEGVQAYGSVP